MPEPDTRALRIYILLATALVVVGCVAGFYVWWVAHGTPRAAPERTPEDVSSIVLGPVDFLPETTADERVHITRLLEDAIFQNPDPRRPSPYDQAIVDYGELAAARLMDAYFRLSQSPGFRDEMTRHRGGAVDRLLQRIQRDLPPAPFPGQKGRGDDPVAGMERRARVWRAWWDALQARKGTDGRGR
jgi:hypothetical protein